jgi:predicted PurR-regulated permease PerM
VGYVAALYAGIQVIESYVITPMIQRQVIAMPPALILSAQIVMGVLQGILGPAGDPACCRFHRVGKAAI